MMRGFEIFLKYLSAMLASRTFSRAANSNRLNLRIFKYDTKYNVITNLLVRSCANIVYAVSLVAKQRRYPGIVSIERSSPRPFFHPRAIRNEFETSASRIWVTSRQLISYAVYRAHSET